MNENTLQETAPEGNCGIYKAMANVMAGIQAIPKDKKMNAGNIRYNFRGIDDVYNAVQPLLAKEGIFILPHCVERIQAQTGSMIKVLCRMRYTFMHQDGSSVSCEVVGEANDTSDKGTNKAMSIAIKYALFQMFCIPTDEMPDPDAHYIENEAASTRGYGKGASRNTGRGQDSARDFMLYLDQVFGGDYKRGLRDISDFLGRNVQSVDDLSEKEMAAYRRATEEVF